MSSEKQWMNPKRALAAYAVVFSLFIMWASARTAIDPGPHGGGIRYLAFAEIIGAILFVWRKTRPVGLVILLIVFAVAAVIELHLHEWPVRFVFYASACWCITFLDSRSRQSVILSESEGSHDICAECPSLPLGMTGGRPREFLLINRALAGQCW